MRIETLRLIGVAKDTLTAGPESVYLDINTGCNLNCNFCWIHSPRQKTQPRPRNLPVPTIIKVLDCAQKWGSSEIVLSGDGEPTFHPQFKTIAEECRRREFTTFLTTNAAFPEPLMATVARIDYLYINFSAPNADLYAKIQSPRNPRLFERVSRNLKILGAIAKKNKHPHLTIACIVNRSNFHAIPAVMDFAEKTGMHKITFRMMEPTRATRALLLSAGDKKALVRLARLQCRTKRPFAHNLGDIVAGLEDSPANPYRLGACFSGWYNLFVDFNGNVGICCHNEKLIVGNLRHASLEDLWTGPRAQRLRLACKYHFDIRRAPFKGECEWCHWQNANTAIAGALTQFNHAR